MFHTPLCPKDCEIRHHDVITSLQALTPRFSSAMNAAIFGPSRVTRGNNKDDFKKQVHKLVAAGWKKDKNVPENSKDFQLPLLHLVSMFGKYEAVDWLLNEEDFDGALRSSSSNETALHVVARHLYKALLSGSSRLENMSISAKVANFEKVVSLLITKEVSLFWAKDGLNKDTPFHILAKHLLAANSAEADSGIEDQCLAFYSKSFNVILKLLLAEEDGRLSRKDVMQALSVKNGDGETPLHIVARATKHGHQILKFLVKSMGSSDLLKLKNEKSLTVLNIVSECYPGHDKDLIVEEEGRKQLDPADFPGKKLRHKASSTDEPDQGTADPVQLVSRSSSNPMRLCRNDQALGHDSDEDSEGCAFHTKYFPGVCSPDCFNTMGACSEILCTHTPLCQTDCDLQHHLLTCCVFSPSVVFRTDSANPIPLTFRLCLQTSFIAGWEKHMNVPDPLASLRLPLLHLVCLSGNLLAVTTLIQHMKFKLSVPSRSNETPLHLVARYFPVTHADSKIPNFLQILNFLTGEDQGMFFKFDLKGDTVLHILAQCFNGMATKLQAITSEAPLDKSALVKQKNCYYKAIKVCLRKLSDLQLSSKLCKKQICKLVHDKNSAGKTFLDIMQGGPDSVMGMILQTYAKEMLPYCFGDERRDLAGSVCQTSCPCSGRATSSESPDCQAQDCQIEEGESSVQEPVSSSQSPPVEVNDSTADVSEPQSTYDQPTQVEVAPSSALPRRPQAQVHSIQVLGQAMTGNSSPQANAAAQPVQHIPVVFIKQEPVDLQHDVQCFVTTNSRLEGHPPRRNAFIIHTGSAITNSVESPSPGKSLVHPGGHSPSNPSSLQSLLQCVQAVSNVTTTRTQGLTVVTQTPTSAQHGVRTPTVNQPSSTGTQTTALLQQGRQVMRAPTVTRQSTAGIQSTALLLQTGRTAGQTARTPSVNQAPQGQTGVSKDPSGREELPQAKQVQSKRTSTESIKEMALETLNKYKSDYRIEFFHTPLCYGNCSIDHHHLILTLVSSSNRLISRGTLNSFTQLLETTKVNFVKCLKKHLDEGFAKDLDMSDGLVVLKYPLIHLAGIFFKYTAIDLLVHLGFERNPRSSRTGELPLHSTLRHGFTTGLKLYKSFAMNRNYEKLFSRVFKSFSSETNVIALLSQQDKNGDTPLHVAAKRMIERPAPLSKSSNIVTSEIPDSTQECESSSSKRGAPSDVNPVCNLSPPSEQHRSRADFYIHCLECIMRKVQETATNARKVNIGLVKPLFLTKNNEGETFLQIMCKEHHIASMAINDVLNRFPDVTFVNCVKESIPEACWPYTCLLGGPFVEEESTSSVLQNDPVCSPTELSGPSNKQSDAQPSKPESPQPSSDVNLTQVSPSTPSTSSVNVVAQDSPGTPSTSKTIQVNSVLISPASASNTSDRLDSVLTPVVANPGHATLRPNTKRKIIEALREDYTERLELAEKGRREVEEDILKHRSKTEELAEVMARKREEMLKLERELQELQKEMWHKNQAIQALENSLEQFTKEEEELGKNLAALQGADPEPPSKKSRTQEDDSSEQETSM